MSENITDAAAPTTEATTQVETSETGSVPATQENSSTDIAAKLAEFEQQIQNLNVEIEKKDKVYKEAQAEAIKWQATYKGLQRQTTQKLQEAAALQQQLVEANKTKQQLADVEEYLKEIAGQVLDEQARKDIEYRQRENRLKQMEQAQQAAQLNVQQPIVSPTFEEPRNEKQEFIDYYFPGLGIDSTDPNIDWADGKNGMPDATSPQEAFRRVTTSVLKIKEQRETASRQDVVADLQKQAQDTLVALRKQAEEELAKAKMEAVEAARKESETKLRQMGIDAGGSTPAPASRPKFQTRMNDQLDESLLTQGEPGSAARKNGEREFQRRLAELKTQFPR